MKMHKDWQQRCVFHRSYHRKSFSCRLRYTHDMSKLYLKSAVPFQTSSALALLYTRDVTISFPKMKWNTKLVGMYLTSRKPRETSFLSGPAFAYFTEAKELEVWRAATHAVKTSCNIRCPIPGSPRVDFGIRYVNTWLGGNSVAVGW